MPLDPLRITNKSEGSGGIGDMLKAIYDPDNDGCVTCADSSTVANTASFADEAGYLTDMTALQAQELTGGGSTTLHSHVPIDIKCGRMLAGSKIWIAAAKAVAAPSAYWIEFYLGCHAYPARPGI